MKSSRRSTFRDIRAGSDQGMNFYLAPMEGITGYIYRNAVKEYFGVGIAKYFTPFLVVHEKKPVSSKEKNDILPEHNEGINLIPQILTDDALGFLRIEAELSRYGYNEVNLNLGCPSKTVANKGRGSGFLARPGELDDFLYKIFEGRHGDISVKTRIGTTDTDEFKELLEIFNKYPIKELIIHPRLRYEYYKGSPHRDVFYGALERSLNPVCYNGDVYSGSDMDELIKGTQNRLEAVMIGRGMLTDPSLIRCLSGGKPYTKEEINEFLRRLREDYSREFSGERPVLQKLKELWSYMGMRFPDKEAAVKNLLKCRSLTELKMFEMQILG